MGLSDNTTSYRNMRVCLRGMKPSTNGYHKWNGGAPTRKVRRYWAWDWRCTNHISKPVDNEPTTRDFTTRINCCVWNILGGGVNLGSQIWSDSLTSWNTRGKRADTIGNTWFQWPRRLSRLSSRKTCKGKTIRDSFSGYLPAMTNTSTLVAFRCG
jgi:hypothetical protein